MREAANQHNIFICIFIPQSAVVGGLVGRRGVGSPARPHIKFERHKRLASTRARQTKSGRIENRAMCRADQRVARSVQKPIG